MATLKNIFVFVLPVVFWTFSFGAATIIIGISIFHLVIWEPIVKSQSFSTYNLLVLCGISVLVTVFGWCLEKIFTSDGNEKPSKKFIILIIVYSIILLSTWFYPIMIPVSGLCGVTLFYFDPPEFKLSKNH